MSYEVRISSRAKDDLRRVHTYIASNLKEPKIAAKLYNRIKTEIQKLDEMPERFPLYPDEPWRSFGLRRLVVGNYLVFYWVDEPEQAVAIFRIMYGGRNVTELLNEENEADLALSEAEAEYKTDRQLYEAESALESMRKKHFDSPNK